MFQTPLPAHVRLVPIPLLATGGRWRVEAMRSIAEPLFLWFTHGQGRITVSGRTRDYAAHDAIFIPAGVMHGFEVGPQVFGTAVFFGRADVAAIVACYAAYLALMASLDDDGRARAASALMKQRKIDVDALRAAAEG